MTMDWNGPYFTVSDIRRLVEGKFTTGISAAERAAIDKSVANFLRTKSAPGISIAIARNDRLVYAKGFGYAKKPIWWALFTRGEPVSVWHRPSYCQRHQADHVRSNIHLNRAGPL